jgi:hypothetical protein
MEADDTAKPSPLSSFRSIRPIISFPNGFQWMNVFQASTARSGVSFHLRIMKRSRRPMLKERVCPLFPGNASTGKATPEQIAFGLGQRV